MDLGGNRRGNTYLVGVVDNASMISAGRLFRNAPKQLIVLGT